MWRHFPAVDRSPAGLAQATLRFHEHYGSDFLKITPHGGYAVEAWGCVESEEVLPDGHRPCARCAVKAPEDWKKIRPLDPTQRRGLRAAARDDHPPAASTGASATPRCADAVLAAVAGAQALGRPARRRPARAPERGHGRPGGHHRDAHPLRRRALTGGRGGHLLLDPGGQPQRPHRGGVRASSASPTTGASSSRSRGRSSLTIVHCHGERLMFDRLAAPARPRLELGRPRDGALAARGAGAGAGRGDRRARPVGDAAGRHARGGGRRRRRTRSRRPAAPGSSWRRAACSPMNTPDANVAAVVKALGGPLKPVPGIRARREASGPRAPRAAADARASRGARLARPSAGLKRRGAARRCERRRRRPRRGRRGAPRQRGPRTRSHGTKPNATAASQPARRENARTSSVTPRTEHGSTRHRASESTSRR